MEEYRHYIRTDEAGVVVLGFTSAFPEIATPQQGDLLLSGQDGRHFTIPLTNERGQYIYRVVDGAMVARSQEELDVEWNARPAPPPSDIEKLKSAQAEIILTLVMNDLM